MNESKWNEPGKLPSSIWKINCLILTKQMGAVHLALFYDNFCLT